ncbi:Uncharacterised protein [Bordetella pertussis]|nr:Uncharacterised protein [Bordetella pertussis]CFO70492.1 Uncharacterised protein [Bordetella pertussis]CFP65562.1 Uncharacterised protein [Bordetella pertussis]CFU81909.1 Uncharacterised protein [Bordetella pertussis]CPI34582.1 Uncharacterised protein [Bordetella pertussis]
MKDLVHCRFSRARRDQNPLKSLSASSHRAQ